ncbi:mucin 6, gastric [Mus musculus]|nr:mucin 6, gastric [Mus musculus]
MLRVRQLLLLLLFRGPLIDAGAWTGDVTDSDTEDNLQSSPEKGWCSTWGAGHFSTFDGHEYNFQGMCNYIFTATCGDDVPATFSIQLRRDMEGNISRIIMELGASVVTVNKETISVRDIGVVSLPYTSNGLQITPYGQSVQLVAKQLELELVITWGPDAHLTVQVETKYMGKLCGLCGNFDGKIDNEFLSEDGKLLEAHKYATLQKLDDPNEICAHEAIPSTIILKTRYAQICNQLLTLVSPGCDVPKETLMLSCQADMAACARPGQPNCSCATLSEYSRRCSMTGQPVRNWRTPALCPMSQCPANQVYQECGEVCIKTCSNPQHSCSSPCTFGCFCPHGTLLDDISGNQSCVPVNQCPCMLNGMVYGPGEITKTACQTCQCTMGRWTCTKQPCPGHCSLEGGSFVTTFDARPYRFHGTCTYTLLQSPQLPNEGTLMAVYDKSGYSHSETSLVAIMYLSKKDKIVISEDEVITNNGDTKLLPYKTHNITIFRQTSTHLQMATTFGLELVFQMQPVFQVYITVGPQFKGQTRGLCGNFNGDTTDDFTTSMGIDEGTASLFVDSWRAGNCPAALEREMDPCSMSQLNKVCAETHCSMLLKKGSVFEKCHSVVNPQPFYKRCVYQACNYEETFPHICSALGAYAHACSARGILLWGWRNSVDNCTVPCTGNRTFSYDSQACDRTCLSLSDRETECHVSPVPVDGCNCPEGTYLNHKAECVHKAQCPCLLDDYKFVQADQSTMINGVICHCINGRLSCPRQAEMFFASCPEPKTFQSCSQSSEDKFGAACAPTCQMLATGIDCVPTKCESGCVCPKGLYENSDGQCVPAEECPCDYAGVSYPGGFELHTDCKTCTCSQGRWTCQLSTQCPSTCVLYGEGHIITFDGQRFVFDGDCEYMLATDDCGANSSQPTFKVLTENVICGKSGVTCSRAIKISLGGLFITMADSNYTVSGEEPLVHLKVKPSPLNLVLDIDIPGRLNLTLVWNKHMSVSIKIRRATQDALCGLCGNANGNMKDDFETRSKYVASNELEFVNSWKESPLCGDASYAVDPCSLNTFRRSWAERKCNIINSQTFAACHSKVYHLPYYEACVRDACGCDTGGDCECLCDAVAAYAKACLDKGVCVDWRTPDFCPIYCDFYNTHTLVGENEYQYAQESNCTWHYQPCLCPGSLGSFPDTNTEGCYNCSQNEYFDHSEGTCVPCAPPTTTLPPTTTGSQPTTETTISTEFHSSTSANTPVAPSYLPGLPTPPPSAPSSTEELTVWTTPKESTVSSGEYPQTTMAATPPTSPWPPTSIPKSTPTELPVTQATSKPTASSLSSSTKTTAELTESTTVTLLTLMPGMSTSQGKTSASYTTQHQSTSFHLTTISKWPTNGVSDTPGVHTSSGTPSSSHATHITYTPPTQVVSSITHSTGPPLGTSVQTTINFPTLSAPQTSLVTPHPGLSSSSTALTSEILKTPTSSQMVSSASPQTIFSSIHPKTTLEATTPQHTAPLITSITSSITQAQSSFSTDKTYTSQHSQPSTMTAHQSRSLPTVTTSTKSTMGLTGTPPVHTTSGTTSSPQTPRTTHPFSTVAVSNTKHTTGVSLETSVQTTIASPTPSAPQTSLATHLPFSSTSSVTPTSEVIITPTPQHTLSSASTSTTTGNILPTTIGQTGSPHTSVPVIYTTSAITQTKTSFSTDRTSTSTSAPHLSETSAVTAHQSTPTAVSANSIKPTMSSTGTPVVHTTSGTTSSPQTPRTTHPSTTVAVSGTVHTTGLPSGTSVHTTTNFPTHSGPQSSLSTHLPLFSTLSVTPTTEGLNTPTSPHSLSVASTSMPLMTVLPTTLEGTRPPHTSVPVTYTTTAATQTKSSFSTDRTSTPHLSQSSTVTPTQSTPIPATTNSLMTTGGLTGTPPVHTTSGTTSSPQTPRTTHPFSTVAVSNTKHTTGVSLETSVQTTIASPTPSAPQTSLATHLPFSSTSSVTPTSEVIITPTPQHTLSSASTSTTMGNILPTTIGQTGSPHTSVPVIYTTSAITQTKTSFSTDRTSTSTSAPHLSETSAVTAHQSTPTAVSANSIKPTMSSTGTPVVHTTSGTTSSPQTPRTTHPSTTVAVSGTVHTTGLPSGTSVHTTTNFPTHSGPQSSLSTHLPLFSTLSVTPTTEGLNTPTSPHSLSAASTSMPLMTVLPTTLEGTRPPHTSVPVTYTTTAATQTKSSFSTDRTSTPHLSQSSTVTPTQPTPIPATTNSPMTTVGLTGTPVVHTPSGTSSIAHTPHTTHSLPTAASSSTTLSTAPQFRTSEQSTTTFPTPSAPQTSLVTSLPPFSTSSVSPTDEIHITSTNPHTVSSVSMSRPVSTILQTTIEVTTPPNTSTPVTHSTSATTEAQGSFSTERTSTSYLSHPSSTTVHQSTAGPVITSIKSTMGVTGTPPVHTTSGTTSSPQTPHSTHPISTAAISRTTGISGTPFRTPMKTTITFPTPSSLQTSMATLFPPFSTSVMSSTEIFNTPTNPHSVSSASTSRPLSTSLPTTIKGTGTPQTPVSDINTTSATTQAHSSFPTTRTSTSHLSLPSSMTSTLTPASRSASTLQYTPTPSSVSHSPLLTTPTASPPSSAPTFVSPTAASTVISSALPTIHMTPTPSSRPTSSTGLLSTSKTTSHVPTFSSFSSKSTTAHLTSLTTQAATSGLLSSTMGMTNLPSSGSPDINHTTRPPGSSPLPTSAFLSRSTSPTGSSSPSTPVSSSNPDSSVSSPPSHPGTCSLQEEEHQITYQGCVANVTLTRCQGFCASSVSFNKDTLQLESSCGCCQPLSTYKKQLSLPCPDPDAPGQQLTLTLQVFSSCVCSPLQCKN